MDNSANILDFPPEILQHIVFFASGFESNEKTVENMKNYHSVLLVCWDFYAIIPMAKKEIFKNSFLKTESENLIFKGIEPIMGLVTYFPNGRRHGKYIGTKTKVLDAILEEGDYIDGKKEGMWKNRRSRFSALCGQSCEKTCVYKNGQKHGPSQVLTSDYGTRKVTQTKGGHYENGKKEGWWEITSPHEYGDRSRGTFVKGKKHGEWEEYVSKEEFVREGVYGRPYCRGFYGKVLCRGQYENGQREGVWTISDNSQGKNSHKVNYCKGKLL